jgi:hypothetical protein
MFLVGCATTKAAPRVPPFHGEETEWWLVQDTGTVHRDDLLPAFEASARRYGCTTERHVLSSGETMYWRVTSYYGVSASCDEGIIALVGLADGRIRIGCAKPTTHYACDLLLGNITQAR